jgi:hypothetical protein
MLIYRPSGRVELIGSPIHKSRRGRVGADSLERGIHCGGDINVAMKQRVIETRSPLAMSKTNSSAALVTSESARTGSIENRPSASGWKAPHAVVKPGNSPAVANGAPGLAAQFNVDIDSAM